jgi:hypothetical protein
VTLLSDIVGNVNAPCVLSAEHVFEVEPQIRCNGIRIAREARSVSIAEYVHFP